MHSLSAASTALKPFRHRGLLAVGLLLLVLLAGLILQIEWQFFEQVSPPRTLALILLDLAALLVLMAYVVMARATRLWRRARNGLIGTRLQSRIVLMFCMVAIIPTMAVSGFSAFFFNYGVKTWFDTRVAVALEDSVKVASAYLDEHKNAIRSDALSLAGSISPQLTMMIANPTLFRTLLNQEIANHNLSEAVLFDEYHVIARTTLSFSLTFERMPEAVLSRADSGQVVVFGEDKNKIQAVLKISRTPELYLLISRVVDPTVLEHMESARTTVQQYHRLSREISVLQQQFLYIFLLVALLVLMASVWVGMALAVRLIDPLIELMGATERVRAGDYSIRVKEGRPDDEIANLGRTFNRMTGQLESQRRDIMEANRVIDERRRFIETVLAGLSAGVIAIDESYRITLCNPTAFELLGHSGDTSYLNHAITELLPQVKPLLEQAGARPDRVAAADIVIERNHARATLHVQVAAERFNETIEGYIVTFDDITELVAAQRSAAWADVARRIAHEIKNPLTPITLSAERLRKKFGTEISDRESYERYLDTIGRHVKDIGRMVDEFATFARMPTPKMQEENLGMLLRKTVFSEKTVHPEITYQLDIPEDAATIRCDEAQLRQLFTNLMKNAAEALEQTDGEKRIALSLAIGEETVTVTVADNGPGFPPAQMAQLMEPYVTTRAKGTGLGLAIVKRTMEEHRGSIALSNRPEGGALVTLTFPKI